MAWTKGVKNGIVYLGGVKWDNNYNNVMLFANRTAQHNFMTSTLTKQSGAIIYAHPDNYIDIQQNIKDIEKVNYCYYRNDDDISNTYFCCFVTKWEYVANDVTRLYLQLDVFQQFCFEVKYYQSRIIRAHISKSNDIVGKYTENEPFTTVQDNYKQLLNFTPDLSPYYVLHCLGTIGLNDKGDVVVIPYNSRCGGIPNNLCLGSSELINIENAIKRYADLATNVLFFNIPQDGRQNCQYIQVVPEFTAGGNYTDPSDAGGDYLNIKYPDAKTKDYTFNYDTNTMANGYTPKNKKLFTSLFQNVAFVSRNGAEFTYKPELFSKYNNISFQLRGSCGGNGTYCTIMNNYKASDKDRFNKVNYGGLVSLGYDANNSASATFERTINNLQSILGLGFSIGMTAVGIPSAPLQAVQKIGLAQNVVNTASGVAGNTDTRQANIVNTGSSSSLDDFGLYTYASFLYIKSVNYDFAVKADEYLTRYGYALNTIENVTSFLKNRSQFNYIQTDNINLSINTSSEWANIYRNIFNNGVTIWHNYNNFGNVGVSND